VCNSILFHGLQFKHCGIGFVNCETTLSTFTEPTYMRRRRQLVTPLMIAALATSVAVGACAGRQVYDPYYSDYHRWNSSENGFYRRWEGETGRAHVAFGRRPAVEQRAYFGWRHGR
jgi:hypothetical protein